MSIRIKPWPFEDRIVKLHWFGHVRLKQKRWRINVAFEDQNQLKWLDVPIGLLPILCIGQYYHNGQPLSTQKDGSIDYMQVENLKDGQLHNALDACRPSQYYLYANPECLEQKMVTFSISGVHYHIPHVELIRALYTKNKLIANALLRPGGLDYFVKNISTGDEYVNITFSDEISGNLVKDDRFLLHFVWLYTNSSIKQSFESIYSDLYARAVQTGINLAKGHPLEMSLPDQPSMIFQYRGRRINSNVLIYEITGFEGISHNIYEIVCSHRSFKKRVRTKKPRKKLIIKTEMEKSFEINRENHQNPKQDVNQPVTEHDPTQIKFDYTPAIRRIAQGEQLINKGDEYLQKKGRGGAHFPEGSVNESILGGDVQPIEFNTLEITDDIKGHGLDDFFRMIQYLQNQYEHLHISMSIVYLPMGRKFSWLPDERRRICAVVKVFQSGRAPVYILEIGRPDNKPLSTLILKLDGNIKEHEQVIQFVLKGLVYNSGNWKRYQLYKLNHTTLKHSKSGIDSWAMRLYGKLIV